MDYSFSRVHAAQREDSIALRSGYSANDVGTVRECRKRDAEVELRWLGVTWARRQQSGYIYLTVLIPKVSTDVVLRLSQTLH